MTEQLDDVVYGRISELSELANDLLNANDAISAIELLLGALNLLPNPKNNPTYKAQRSGTLENAVIPSKAKWSILCKLYFD